ncbi:hypothetical protein AVEN_91125-1, partial [Araneus ventricosus]
YEELLTVSCDLETTINSRPLTYLSDEMEELMPLTPSLFLQDLKQTGVPDLDLVDSSKLNIRVKHCDSIRKELRSRFRKEYLSQLIQKANVKDYVQNGEPNSLEHPYVPYIADLEEDDSGGAPQVWSSTPIDFNESVTNAVPTKSRTEKARTKTPIPCLSPVNLSSVESASFNPQLVNEGKHTKL